MESGDHIAGVQQQQHRRAHAAWRDYCTIGIYDGHWPRALSHYTVIIIIRTAFSSGNRSRNRTQIGINFVCNHRSD